MSGKKGMKVPKKSLDNLTGKGRFAKDKEIAKECQKLAVAKRKENQEKQKEIEKSADILMRLLSKQIKNKATGEEITQKEAMLLTLLNKALVEQDLNAMKMILQIIGEIDNKLVSINMTNRNANISIDELKALKSEIEKDE